MSTVPRVFSTFRKRTAAQAKPALLSVFSYQASLGQKGKENRETYYLLNEKHLEEGALGTDQLYIFPTAKSTEVTFLNKMVFDRFSKDTGASYENLSTFEGIAETAALYYDWTDAQTPDIPNDGKAFYHSDSLFRFLSYL